MANHVYFNIDLSLDAGQTTLVEKLGESCAEEQGEMKEEGGAGKKRFPPARKIALLPLIRK